MWLAEVMLGYMFHFESEGNHKSQANTKHISSDNNNVKTSPRSGEAKVMARQK